MNISETSRYFCNTITLDNRRRRASKFPPLSGSSSSLLPDDYLAIAKLSDGLNPRKDFLSASQCSGSPFQPRSRQLQHRRASGWCSCQCSASRCPCHTRAAVCLGSTSPLTENNVHYRGKKKTPKTKAITRGIHPGLLPAPPPLREDAAVPFSVPPTEPPFNATTKSLFSPSGVWLKEQT